jgi:hypothetical protein
VTGKYGTLALAFVVLVMVLAGCTSTPAKPVPQNPAGTLLEARAAVYFAKDYIYKLYGGSSVIVPFNVTLKMTGGPAAWDGDQSGNCTKWFLYLEGVMLDVKTYRYIKVAVEETYKDGQVRSSHSNVKINAITSSEVNATSRSIQAVSIEKYLGANVSTHALLAKAQSATHAEPAGTYLQSLSINLYHESISPISGTALWQYSWRYISNSTGNEAFVKVDLSPIDGSVIRVENPK